MSFHPSTPPPFRRKGQGLLGLTRGAWSQRSRWRLEPTFSTTSRYWDGRRTRTSSKEPRPKEPGTQADGACRVGSSDARGWCRAEERGKITRNSLCAVLLAFCDADGATQPAYGGASPAHGTHSARGTKPHQPS